MKTMNLTGRVAGHVASALFGVGVIFWMVWVYGGFGRSPLATAVFSNACIVFAIATIAWSLRSWWIIRRLSRLSPLASGDCVIDD